MIHLLPALLLAAAAGPGDSVVGRWRTETRGGIVEIERCGASICGRILTSENLRTHPELRDTNNRDASQRGRLIKGLQILSGFSWSDGAWQGGRIYNAEDGRTYNARITPSNANELKLRGCVFVPLCKTQTWTRIR